MKKFITLKSKDVLWLNGVGFVFFGSRVYEVVGANQLKRIA